MIVGAILCALVYSNVSFSFIIAYDFNLHNKWHLTPFYMFTSSLYFSEISRHRWPFFSTGCLSRYRMVGILFIRMSVLCQMYYLHFSPDCSAYIFSYWWFEEPGVVFVVFFFMKFFFFSFLIMCFLCLIQNILINPKFIKVIMFPSESSLIFKFTIHLKFIYVRIEDPPSS